MKQCVIVFWLLVSLSSLGCATHSNHKSNNDAIGADSLEDKVSNKDPFEKVNRAVFKFNDTLDRYLLKPAAKGYRVITPEPVEIGIHNFFRNLSEVTNVANDLMQAKWRQAGEDSARFFINTVFGVAGIFDPATEAGIDRAMGEDFGQTLRVWGFSEGPYLVIPFLGSSSLLDLAADPVDWLTSPLAYVEPSGEKTAVLVVQTVQNRAQLLNAEELVSGDKYTFFREAYRQNREFNARDGRVEDDFGGELDDFDDL